MDPCQPKFKGWVLDFGLGCLSSETKRVGLHENVSSLKTQNEKPMTKDQNSDILKTTTAFQIVLRHLQGAYRTMKLLNHAAVILILTVVCSVSLYGQEVKPIEAESVDFAGDISSVRWETATNSHWFVFKRVNQSGSQTATATDGYVFPKSGQRFKRYVKNTVGPVSLLKNAASAGLSQWSDSPEEWGQGTEGYGRRLASSFGSTVIRQTVTYGLSEGFRLDTGFERSKRKGFWPRLSDALVQNVTSRTRSGKRVVSVPIIAGAYAGAVIPRETWYPSRYSYKDGLRVGTYSLASGFAINVAREFVLNF